MVTEIPRVTVTDAPALPRAEGAGMPKGSFPTAKTFLGWLSLWEVLLLIVGAGGLLFWDLGRFPLLDWDEGVYAQVAREMVESGDWLNLSWNGEPYFKKPPLLFWLIALGYHLFGVSEWAVRVFSALFGVGNVLWVYLLGRQIQRRSLGALSALLLLSLHPFLYRGGRQGTTDSLLLFFLLGALYTFWRGRTSPSFLYFTGLAVGFATLSKGIAGLIPLLIIGVFAVVSRETRLLRSRAFGVGLGLGGVVGLSWYLQQALCHGWVFIESYIVKETLERMITTYDAPEQPLWFYLEVIWRDIRPLGLLLWGLPFMVLLAHKRQLWPLSPSVLFLLSWVITALVLPTAVQTRHSWYLLPLYPALCLLLGQAFLAPWSLPHSQGTLLKGVALFLVALFLLQAPGRWQHIFFVLRWEQDQYQGRERNRVAMAVREWSEAADPVYVVGQVLPGMVFYSQRRCAFVSPEVGWERLHSENRAFVLMEKSALAGISDQEGVFLLAQEGEWYLLTNALTYATLKLPADLIQISLEQ